MSLCAPVAALVLLAACGAKSEASNAAGNATANDAAATAYAAAPMANEATPAATPAAAGSTTLSADYMVGKWSAMGEDCSATIEFKKDGTVDTPIGTAKYTVAGDRLSFDYGDGSKPTVSTIKVLSPERIEIVRASGGQETEKRC
jgi:hypothetical protein